MTARKNESSFERDSRNNITDKVHKIKTFRGTESRIAVVGSITNQGKEVHPPNRKLAASSLSQLQRLQFNQESAGSPVKHYVKY